MTKLLAGIRLLRPLNCLTGALAILVSAAITQSLDDITTMVIAMVVVVFYNGGANAINDYFDYEIDRINRPNRPLSSGTLSRKTGLWIAIFMFLLGTLFALQLNTIAKGIAILVAMPVLVVYTVSLKNKPLVGNVAVAFILGLVFLFGGAVFESMSVLVIPAFLAFLLTFLRELIKDVEDMKGDKKLGLNTFPLTAGLASTFRIVRWWALVTGIIMLLPAWVEYYNAYYLWIVLFGICLPLVYIIRVFFDDPGMKKISLATKLLKASTIAGVVAVYFGSV